MAVQEHGGPHIEGVATLSTGAPRGGLPGHKTDGEAWSREAGGRRSGNDDYAFAAGNFSSSHPNPSCFTVLGTYLGMCLTLYRKSLLYHAWHKRTGGCGVGTEGTTYA